MRCPACEHENTNLATRCAACGRALPTDVALAPGSADDCAATESLMAPTLPNVDRAATESLMAPTLSIASTGDGPTSLSAPPEPSDSPEPSIPSSDSSAPAGSLDEVERTSAVLATAASATEESPTASLVPKPPAQESPKLRRFAGAAGQHVKASHHPVESFLVRHQRAIGIGLAILVVGILVVAWLTINVVNTPTYAQIEQDMARLAPEYVYTGGTYGPDLTLPLSDVTITERAATQTPEGMEVSDGMSSTAYGVESQLTYDDGRVRVVRDVCATYVRGENDWTIAGELSEKGLSSVARAGVDEDKVINNIGAILAAADSAGDGLLPALYDGGNVQILSNAFDEQKDGGAIDDLTIHCIQTRGFCTYEGNVNAHFVFDDGMWTLGTAEADEGATTRSYASLAGTWVGELLSTSSTTGGACYGAQENPLTITIDAVGEGDGQVSGTISCIAHFHESLKKDKKKDANDELLDGLDFVGTLDATGDAGTGTNLRIVCTTAGTPDGSVDFELCFGTADDPNTVTAIVTTTHEYEEPVLLFFPLTTSARFVDTYSLWRA